MAKSSVTPSKVTPPSKPWSPPKELLGRPMSSGSAARTSTSGYGKLGKLAGAKTMIPRMK